MKTTAVLFDESKTISIDILTINDANLIRIQVLDKFILANKIKVIKCRNFKVHKDETMWYNMIAEDFIDIWTVFFHLFQYLNPVISFHIHVCYDTFPVNVFLIYTPIQSYYS